MAIKVRPATLDDGPLISELAATIDSAGAPFGVRMCLLKDAYTVFTRHPKSRGLVALTTDDRVVGYHFSRPLTVLINDVPIRSTFGFNLAVHPDFRCQGIGSKIVRTYQQNCIHSGIELAFSNTEEGNIAQRRNAKKTDLIEVRSQIRAMVTTRRLRPRLPAGIQITQIDTSDFCRWSDAANEFYRYHNFWQPISVDLLKAWSAPVCNGCKRSLYVAKGSEGQLLAGLGIDDCSQLFRWHIYGVPWPARVVGRLVKIADRKGHVPFAKVVLLWYQKGKADVARLLWEWIRWDLRQDVRLIVVYFDPLSPVRKAVRPSVYLPKMKSIRFARLFSDIKINSARPIATEFI
jgi:GNAT superfamily N-acetyltransferase